MKFENRKEIVNFKINLKAMLEKKEVLKSIKNLPDSFSIDDLVERIIFLQKLDEGLKQSENNETFSTVEAKKKLKKWLK